MINQEDGDHLLASNAERDAVISRISDAYASGQLTADEFGERSDKALTARTYADLDNVLKGIGEMDRPEPPRPRSPRQIAFYVAAAPLAAVILYSIVVVAFGVDMHDRAGGVVMLAAFLPMLWGLHRWAWPRKP